MTAILDERRGWSSKGTFQLSPPISHREIGSIEPGVCPLIDGNQIKDGGHLGFNSPLSFSPLVKLKWALCSCSLKPQKDFCWDGELAPAQLHWYQDNCPPPFPDNCPQDNCLPPTVMSRRLVLMQWSTWTLYPPRSDTLHLFDTGETTGGGVPLTAAWRLQSKIELLLLHGLYTHLHFLHDFTSRTLYVW
jgi:hypothetical protein